jgi:Cys-tRNA(Pro)/Cys-tRNA(Cys) deacylase
MAGRSSRHRAGGTPATDALTAAGIPFTMHRYDHDGRATSYGSEAAAALGLDPQRVLKTLMAIVDGRIVVAVVPVAGHLDLKALASACGAKKAGMAAVGVAERATGYVVGGISPVGQRRTHRTVVDESALGFETVFVSGGKRGLDLEVAPADLVRVTAATVAAIGSRPGTRPVGGATS